MYFEFSQVFSSSILTPRASYKSSLSTLILDNAASTLSVGCRSIYVCVLWVGWVYIVLRELEPLGFEKYSLWNSRVWRTQVCIDEERRRTNCGWARDSLLCSTHFAPFCISHGPSAWKWDVSLSEGWNLWLKIESTAPAILPLGDYFDLVFKEF